MSDPVVALEKVSKSFDGVTVLHEVDLAILPGEVHGLVGENGSGKSTLVKILAGMHTPDRGARVRLRGRTVPLPVRDPLRHGLAVVHQDLALVASMSVADNVGIATGFERPLAAPIDRRREARIVGELAASFGLALDPNRPVGELSPAERAVVAILRALRGLGEGRRGSAIVLDEPTAALPRGESLRLLELLRRLARNGTAVLYVSHRLSEVLALCDRISVLRNGRLVATRDAARSHQPEIARLMLGYELGDFYPDKRAGARETVRLEVRDLSGGAVRGVSLEVGAGEILGVTGLAGMGHDDLPYLVAGGRKRRAGTVSVDGRLVDGRPVDGSVRSAKRAGVELVPGDRQRDALWLGGTVAENLTLPRLGELWRGLRIRPKRELELAAREMRRFGVQPPAPSLEIAKLSGGNQQKVVLARSLWRSPRVLLLHEPTQGVDVGAKKEILGVVRGAAAGGAAVVVCSSDFEEVAQLCHRVLILRYGTVSAALGPGDISEDRILALAQQAAVGEARRSGAV